MAVGRRHSFVPRRHFGKRFFHLPIRIRRLPPTAASLTASTSCCILAGFHQPLPARRLHVTIRVSPVPQHRSGFALPVGVSANAPAKKLSGNRSLPLAVHPSPA
jgi:hypothetical protein